ncbi:MAG: hypothetical protein SNH80_02235, partial [Rikenellaceae bacterium]
HPAAACVGQLYIFANVFSPSLLKSDFCACGKIAQRALVRQNQKSFVLLLTAYAGSSFRRLPPTGWVLPAELNYCRCMV